MAKRGVGVVAVWLGVPTVYACTLLVGVDGTPG